VALALALLGLVIHCAPPNSDPCRCSVSRVSTRNTLENRRFFIARRSAAKNRKATENTLVLSGSRSLSSWSYLVEVGVLTTVRRARRACRWPP
jgi:hypothetical protein